MRKFCYILALVLLVCVSQVSAQTFRHDPSILNQFTVMETNMGNLTPDSYYDLFHKGYRNTAIAGWSKITHREAIKQKTNTEKTYSDSIKSDLMKRMKVEDLTTTSRSPDLDVAWSLEKDKIGDKMSSLLNSINKIQLIHPDPTQSRGIHDAWVMRYKCLQNDINILHKSRLTMGDRHSQYMKVYHRIVRACAEISDCLYEWNALRHAKKTIDNAGGSLKRHSANANVAYACLTKWSRRVGIQAFGK